MSNGWRGVYLRADRERVADALVQLATSRSYTILRHIRSIDQPALDNVWDSGFQGRGDTLEFIFLLTINNEWTRLIGLDFADGAYPRLFYSYELVMLLDCDAFECGFVEDVSWWYRYYERGLIVDHFDSNPLGTLLSFRDQIWGPDDVRVLYAKCLGVEKLDDLHPLPPQIMSEFRGHPEKLIPILKNPADNMENMLHDMSPERGLEWLSQVVFLPHIGELETANFLEDLASIRRNSSPIPSWIIESIERGLTLIMLRHPKHFFLHTLDK